MDQELKVLLFPSPEVEEMLAYENFSLADQLSRQLGVELTFGQDPTREGDKDIVLTLIATSALVLAITPTISKILSAVTSKTVYLLEKVLVPVEDSSGNVVRDANGNPILQWVTVAKALDSREMLKEYFKFGIKVLGIEIFFENSSN